MFRIPSFFHDCLFGEDDKLKEMEEMLSSAIESKRTIHRDLKEIITRRKRMNECLCRILESEKNPQKEAPTVDIRFYRYKVDTEGRSLKHLAPFEVRLRKEQLEGFTQGKEIVELAQSMNEKLFEWEIDPDRVQKDFRVQYYLRDRRLDEWFTGLDPQTFNGAPKGALFNILSRRNYNYDTLIIKVVLIPRSK